ncbi:MAG: Nif3-like dinuclear metal center hexameric protein [Gammaproteobacteria bacterium]|nr:Nif3-like dinuclear metal center hexameric protein [Gammaproteobacteria bacterium]
MVERDQLANYCAELLDVSSQRDYCPNGLQVEGKSEIRKIVSGVTASQALVEAAVAAGADALLVHHGYFWKGEGQCIVGSKYRRIASLISAEINLYAYHLPLDIHPQLGNNAQLAQHLGLTYGEAIGPGSNPELVRHAELAKAHSDIDVFTQHVGQVLARQPLLIKGHDRPVQSVAWCTGGAQDYIELAAAAGADVYISGEVSERTFHAAKELGIHYLAAGHHATERYGVQALGAQLAKQFRLDHEFIEIDNPV